jgi:hypothetical protein
MCAAERKYCSPRDRCFHLLRRNCSGHRATPIVRRCKPMCGVCNGARFLHRHYLILRMIGVTVKHSIGSPAEEMCRDVLEMKCPPYVWGILGWEGDIIDASSGEELEVEGKSVGTRGSRQHIRSWPSHFIIQLLSRQTNRQVNVGIDATEGGFMPYNNDSGVPNLTSGWVRRVRNSRILLNTLSFFSDILRAGATPTGSIMSTRRMICQSDGFPLMVKPKPITITMPRPISIPSNSHTPSNAYCERIVTEVGGQVLTYVLSCMMGRRLDYAKRWDRQWPIPPHPF